VISSRWHPKRPCHEFNHFWCVLNISTIYILYLDHIRCFPYGCLKMGPETTVSTGDYRGK
jgi:hypothetical protein